MKPPDAPDVGAWLAKARTDLRMVQMVFAGGEPMWDQVCFHAQQAGEKALKALLTALGEAVPRTHDLVRLVQLLAPQLPAVAALYEDAARLTAHSVTPRYPSWLAPETEADARSAVASAEAVLQLVENLLQAGIAVGPA